MLVAFSVVAAGVEPAWCGKVATPHSAATTVTLAGSAWGDVHMQTLDGAAYDLQAAGEFIAARSEDGSFEIQLRTVPWKDTDNISITTAVAARVDGSKVSITYGADPEVRINGAPTFFNSGNSVRLQGGGTVVRRESSYLVNWGDGSSLEVIRRQEYLNIRLASSAALSGRLSGLLGNANGNPVDDFVTREGQKLEVPVGFDALYSIFANSWRIAAGESLFHYRRGESNETFNLMDFPSRGASAAALSKADRARAEKECLKLNVTEAVALEACVVDVGFTRIRDFAVGALVTQQLNEAAGIVPRLLSDLTGAPQASIQAPAAVQAFTEFRFSWRGPGGDDDLIDMIPAGLSLEEQTGQGASLAIAYAQTRSGKVLTFVAPPDAGAYELRYIKGGRGVIGTRPITVTPGIRTTLEAPASVAAKARFRVVWAGPNGKGDAVYLVPAGSGDELTPGLAFKRTIAGDTLNFVAPSAPGSYELRYVYQTSKPPRVLARIPLQVR